MVYNGNKKLTMSIGNTTMWNTWENWWKRIIKRKKKSNDVSKVGKLGTKLLKEKPRTKSH
jgi:uncharacterized membrane protein